MAPTQRLNGLYDKLAAKEIIESLSLSRSGSVEHAISISHDKKSQLTVFEEQNPRFYRIVHVEDSTEAIFSLVGAVTVVDMDFPQKYQPIEEIRHHAQHIKLVGFGAASFANSIHNLEKLHWQIHRAMSTSNIKPMPISRFHGHPQIHFKCRFFTTGDDATDVDNVATADHVDSSGIIQHFLSNENVRHGEANRVVYRKLTSEGYVNIPPTSIKPGDIAEVEFSVLGAPSHRDGGNFILIQSRVTILDDSIAMKAFLDQCRADSEGCDSGKTRVRVKRRANAVDDVEETTNKMARLTFGVFKGPPE